jgi:hypothetical protein
MKTVAAGSFTVNMTPQTWHEGNPGEGPVGDPVDGSLGRFLLDKQYHGDLEAVSKGQMLSAGDGKPGSSGVYVAIERVTGSLQGRQGSFTLHHAGVMNRGVSELTISVVPDSGTGELTGISGSMAIKMLEGKHSYEFSYTLATIQ